MISQAQAPCGVVLSSHDSEGTKWGVRWWGGMLFDDSAAVVTALEPSVSVHTHTQTRRSLARHPGGEEEKKEKDH